MCLHKKRPGWGCSFLPPKLGKLPQCWEVQEAPRGAGAGPAVYIYIAPLTPQQNPRHSPSMRNNSPSSSRARRSVRSDITGRRDEQKGVERGSSRGKPCHKPRLESAPQDLLWTSAPVLSVLLRSDCNRCSKRWGLTPECERGHVEVKNPVPSHRGIWLGHPIWHPRGHHAPGQSFPCGANPTDPQHFSHPPGFEV